MRRSSAVRWLVRPGRFRIRQNQAEHETLHRAQGSAGSLQVLEVVLEALGGGHQPAIGWCVAKRRGHQPHRQDSDNVSLSCHLYLLRRRPPAEKLACGSELVRCGAGHRLHGEQGMTLFHKHLARRGETRSNVPGKPSVIIEPGISGYPGRKFMPLYEYRCHRCGKTFELRQKFAEAPLTVHEGCGGGVERIIFASALQFKGSGFYINDYGRGGKSRPDQRLEREIGIENRIQERIEARIEARIVEARIEGPEPAVRLYVLTGEVIRARGAANRSIPSPARRLRRRVRRPSDPAWNPGAPMHLPGWRGPCGTRACPRCKRRCGRRHAARARKRPIGWGRFDPAGLAN